MEEINRSLRIKRCLDKYEIYNLHLAEIYYLNLFFKFKETAHCSSGKCYIKTKSIKTTLIKKVHGGRAELIKLTIYLNKSGKETRSLEERGAVKS